MTGASRGLLSRLDAALTEFGAERATEIAMAHGNAGRSPSNMTPPNVVTSIMRTVHRYGYFRIHSRYQRIHDRAIDGICYKISLGLGTVGDDSELPFRLLLA